MSIIKEKFNQYGRALGEFIIDLAGGPLNGDGEGEETQDFPFEKPSPNISGYGADILAEIEENRARAAEEMSRIFQEIQELNKEFQHAGYSVAFSPEFRVEEGEQPALPLTIDVKNDEGKLLYAIYLDSNDLLNKGPEDSVFIFRALYTEEEQSVTRQALSKAVVDYTVSLIPEVERASANMRVEHGQLELKR